MIKFFKKTEKEPKNLKEIFEYLKKLDRDIKELSQNLADFKKESEKTLQKIGIVRFNPFKEIGGDQSFSIAVLNSNNNGFIITSLYGQEANRVYAKPINNGTSVHSLSKEEKEALDKAMQE